MELQRVDHFQRMYEKIITWDKILFSTQDDLFKVVDWSDTHLYGIFADWNPPLNKGHIDFPGSDGSTDAIVMFEQHTDDESIFNMMEYDYRGKLIWICLLDMAQSSPKGLYIRNSGVHPDAKARFGAEMVEKRMETVVQIFIAIMGYIRANRNTYVITQTDRVKQRGSGKTHSKKGRNGPKVVKIVSRTIYRLSIRVDAPGPAKKREYHAESWTVMGHKRRYRNDKGEVIKEVDVKPYTKGKGQHQPKTYQV